MAGNFAGLTTDEWSPALQLQQSQRLLAEELRNPLLPNRYLIFCLAVVKFYCFLSLESDSLSLKASTVHYSDEITMFFPAFLLGILHLHSLLPSVAASPDRDGPKAHCHYPSLIDATSEQLQAGLSRRCFSSVDLVNAYIKRIAEVNDTLHVVAELNPDAVNIARHLDVERRHGKIRGPLHGLPIVIKGNIGIADRMHTTSGSYALLGAELSEDSTVVAKLKEAGVIILGMAGLSEWAGFRASNSSNGWSAYGGQVIGAYYPRQDPAGSSSGSGVASDLGLAFAALGTETSGSIISPSQQNNIVGIKPTVGLTSRHLVIPISQHLDTVGAMARTVKDAAKLLQIIAGPDSSDNYTSVFPFDCVPDYPAACQHSALKGKRIGIPTNVLEFLSTDPAVVAPFNTAVTLLADSGAIIVRDANYSAYEEFMTSPLPVQILYADLINGIANYCSELKTNPNNIHNLSDLRHFVQTFPLEDYPDRDTRSWDEALRIGVNNTSPEFWPIYQKLLQMVGEGGVLGALRRNNLDAIVLPSNVSPLASGMAGTPMVTVPMSVWPVDTKVVTSPRDLVLSAPGMPMGLSFMGDLWSEETLIGMAYAYEQKSLKRGTLSRYVEPKTELKDVLRRGK
ncbi:amidase [Histoplasma capsulatum H143]|uniref:Amidase n=1 Tax=Ajellomyces capsulatus (strain H143) TaxID=544712 RepID=C6HQQ5_AJECH|nr:amidase [Histoplasma capsulatum H143]